MVRNIVILSGNSHPHLTQNVCNLLGIASGDRVLSKFSGGESRCEIKDSVRGKDVFIIQTGGGAVNDNLMELCISKFTINPVCTSLSNQNLPSVISACKTGSAKRVTAVTPLFPYSRQPDLAYRKQGAPLTKPTSDSKYTFESVPATPGPGVTPSAALSNGVDLSKALNKVRLSHHERNGSTGRNHSGSLTSQPGNFTTHDYDVNLDPKAVEAIEAKPGYKRWVAQAGTLIADLLTCAGADQYV